LVLSLLFCFSPCGLSQMTSVTTVRTAIRTLQERELFPRQGTSNPLRPTGFPGVPGESPPDNTAKEPDLQIVRSGTESRIRGDFVTIRGGAEIIYRGYRIFADSIDGNLRNETFDLQGNVTVLGDRDVIRGDRVVLDTRNEVFTAYDTSSQVSPQTTGGPLLDLLYVRSQRSSGTPSRSFYHDANCTTCSYHDEPHYELEAADVDLRPGKRAILRKTRIRIFGKTVISLPYLVIPLEEYRYKYLPEVGQSDDEGWYIKNRYGIPLQGDDLVVARLDYMSKLGTGYGGDWSYRNRQLNGSLGAYAISGEINTLAITNRHRQDIGWANFTLENDFQRSNYLLAPGATIVNNRAGLNIPQGRSNTRLTYARNANESTFQSSVYEAVSLSDQREFGRGLRTTTDVNWTTTTSEFSSTSDVREQVDVRFRGQQETARGTAAIDYQRSIPVGEAAQFVGGNDRTPVISFSTDATRVLGQQRGRKVPFNLEVSWGEFFDALTSDRIGRSYVDFSFRSAERVGSRLNVTTNGAFRQGVYSDDTAQYTLGLNNQTSYNLGRDTAINFRYSYSRPYGFAPLLIDRAGETNIATLDASVRPIRSFLIGAQTGYDLLRLKESNAAWQQVGIRTEYTPTQSVLFRTLSTYDTFSEQWSNIRMDLTYRPGATSISIGARYDGFRKQWGTVNAFVDGLKIGRSKLSAILNYNGYTKELDAQQYSFTYDLHCAEAVLTWVESRSGFRPGREIQFFLRLKAFPFDSIFGTTRRGAPLGLGTGRDF
jgi:LPS-assembly protein